MDYKKIMWNSFENKENKYLLLDTETTGLDTNKCYILQISFLITDYKFDTILDIFDTIINIGNIKITNSSCHGITTQKSMLEGISIIESFEIFYEYLQIATHLVIYNSNYDIEVIKTELERLKNNGFEELSDKILEEMNLKNIICPMRELKEVLQEKSKNGNFKWSKLSKSYELIVGKEITNAHNSKYDVLNMLEMMKTIYDQKENYNNIKPDISGFTVKKLKEMCKENSIKGYSNKNKEELIEILKNYY